MEKINKFIAILIQTILSLSFITLMSISLIKGDFHLIFFYAPIFIQELLYLIIAYLLFQIPEINKGIETKILHLILIFLTLGGIKIIPSFQLSTGWFFLSSLIIGKTHLLSMLTSAFLFVLCGILKNEIGGKKYKHFLISFITISFLLVSYQRIKTPIMDNINYPLLPSLSFTTLFISIQLISILSFLPSYWHDRSKHNMIRTVSFIIMIISSSLLAYQLIIPYYLTIIATILIIFSEILFIVNMQSYTI